MMHMLTTIEQKTFTPEQAEAFDSLTTMILKDTGQETGVLIGFAGTGKSFLTNRIVEHCINAMPILRFSMTAPTHKAVRVLKQSSETPKNFLFATIHSLLGLKQDVTPKGQVIYKKDYMHTSEKILETDVLIVDEASMLNTELFNHLIDYQKRLGFKMLFVGDPKQINPVGEVESNPFLSAVQKKHNMNVVTLTEIVRQAADNPIIAYATSIRNKEQFDFKGMTTEGIQCLNKTMFALQPVLEKYFLSEEFKVNPDHVKIIAWRNQTVDQFNRIVRQMVYNRKELPKILEGDYLVADKPIMNWNPKSRKWNVSINTSEEMAVISATVKDFPIVYKNKDGENTTLELLVYQCKVRLFDGYEGFLDKVIDILHEDSEVEFNGVLKQVQEYAISIKGDDMLRRKIWIQYYDLQNYFAWTKYNYAVTSHKAQGSTYDNVIVHEWDINLNKNDEEKRRIKYVAATRPRRMLYIVKENE